MSGQQQLSLDDMAAQMADRMFAKSGAAGDLPVGRAGASGAEGGFTPTAGGQVIDKSDDDDADDKMDKGLTGSSMTSEPGRQGTKPQTGSAITSEPGHEGGGGAGQGGNLSQEGDASTRSRKSGKVGGMGDGGAESGKNLSEDEDQKMRGRKGGKVGMAKGVNIEVEDDDEEEDEAEKGGIFDADELIKGLEVLEQVALGSSIMAPADRRAELAEKLAEGTLSKSEMGELSDLLKSDTFAEDDDGYVDPESDEEVFAKSYSEAFAQDATLSDGYEVSPFLERHSQLTAAALDQVQSTLAKSLEDHRDRTSAFNAQLAKSLRGMAQLAQSQDRIIKSMAARLEAVENQPMPRRGVTSMSQVLHKGMGSEVGQSDQLSKSQCADVLEQMAIQGVEATPSGHRVDMAMAMLEQNGQMAKSLYQDIVAFRANGGKVAR